MEGTNGARPAVVTPDDHGPILQIAAWFTMVTMIIMVFLRMAVRFAAARVFGWDDLVIVLAMFMGVGSTIAISLAVNDGLGQRSTIRDLSRTSALQKNVYASSILYFMTVWLAKLSTLILMARLSSQRFHLRAISGAIVLVIAWGLAAIFTDAFRCHVPNTWDVLGGHCINIYAFWSAIGAFDILTDIVLIVIPCWVFARLKMKLSSRIIVIAAFACRIMVIAATATRLAYLNSLQGSTDLYFDSVDFQICTQCQQVLSVIVASAPALKTFVDRTRSGMLNVSLGARLGATYGRDSYRMSQMSGPPRNPSTASHNARHSAYIDADAIYVDEPYKSSPTSASDEPIEHSSQSHRSERGVIRVDQEWSVHNEPIVGGAS